jgi:hypothetical protein
MRLSPQAHAAAPALLGLLVRGAPVLAHGIHGGGHVLAPRGIPLA